MAFGSSGSQASPVRPEAPRLGASAQRRAAAEAAVPGAQRTFLGSMCTNIYIMYIHIYIYIHIRICTYIYIYMYIRIHICMYTYINIYVVNPPHVPVFLLASSIHTYASICIYICQYLYVYRYVCVGICLYIYTHLSLCPSIYLSVYM